MDKSIVSLKGPSFSVELIKNADTKMTLGYESYKQIEEVNDLLAKTTIYLDYTTDIYGIEYLNALENIYAIFIGLIDGKYNFLNMRHFLLNQSFQELKSILGYLKCKQNTAHLACRLGDLSFTALSDLRRNRTLGL